MKNNLSAKGGLEPGTAEFPQLDALTIEPHCNIIQKFKLPKKISISN